MPETAGGIIRYFKMFADRLRVKGNTIKRMSCFIKLTLHTIKSNM